MALSIVTNDRLTDIGDRCRVCDCPYTGPVCASCIVFLQDEISKMRDTLYPPRPEPVW